MQALTNKRILLGVTGGIAAYKSAELIRRLQDQGADVRVVMTRAATEFITPLTLQALSGHPVHLDLLDTQTESVMGHIDLARWADVIVVAPASANFIARLKAGQGDDLLTTICLAAECKIAIAPAMNQAMWAKESTKQNCESLLDMNYLLFGPDEGIQACGELGPGRLLDVEKLVEQTINVFPSTLLTGRKVVITAGPTREALDPVRFISNQSSGKQGYALAEAAIEAGADVTLVSGPTHIPPPERAHLINVVSANEMYDAVMANTNDCDIFIGVAAVSDYKPADLATQKLKKDRTPTNRSITIELAENPDIIASVASLAPRPFTVGFAAETEAVLENARGKLTKKNLDMIIANDVADSGIGFNSDENRLIVLWENHEEELPVMSKHNAARRIIELIAEKTKTTTTSK